MANPEWTEPSDWGDKGEAAAKIIDQYIAQKTAYKIGRDSFVAAACQLQIETAREIADRIAGYRQDEEYQITRYWAYTLGKWVTVPEDEA